MGTFAISPLTLGSEIAFRVGALALPLCRGLAVPLRPTRSWPVMKITCEDRWQGPKEDWKRGGWMEQKKR